MAIRNHTQTLGTAMAELLNSLGIESNIKRHEVIRLWPEIVGERIAAISNAVRVEGQVLFVHVANSTWRNELIYLKQTFLEQISRNVGAEIVKDIRFI